MAHENDIVISGFSAYFPQADHLVEFKEKLYSGVDMITVDDLRWTPGHMGLPGRHGKIRDLSRFDAQFFHRNPKQAHVMDPQLRMLLETSYEAIVDAGYDPDTLRKRNIGVFIANSNSESYYAFRKDEKVDSNYLLGCARSMFSNRVSCSLDVQDTEPVLDDMDTTSTRKRSRPSESGSDDEGASRKMQAVATERVTVMSPTAPPSDTVAEEQPDTPDADGTNENEFQTVFSKSQKLRQRASTAPRPVGNIGPPTAPAATPAAHPSTARVVPEPAKPPTATQAAFTGVLAAADTMLRSALSPLDSGTVLFRPANAGASFHRTSRLAIAQALSALPGVKGLAGIPVTARPPADRSQSSGVVQGVDGDYTNEALLAAVTFEVPVIAARRQATSLLLRFASPVPAAHVHLFRMTACGVDAMDTSLQLAGDYSDACAAVTTMGRTPAAPARLSACTEGRPHSADSAECQLWQRERRLATIKASSPTYLPHREAQASLRSSSSWMGGPQLNQTTGKSYAAAVGAPSKVPRPTGAQQREPPAGPKKQGSTKPRPPTKATSQPHADQENANLRLLLRAVADLLPPENQLRSICLQAAAPCMVSAHPQGRPRCAVYVRRELPHANINVADVTEGDLECCAVTVRLRGVDTTVVSVYVRPGQRWNAADLLQLTARLGHNYLLCGDMNAHHTMWGSRTCSSRGSDLVDVIHQLGLQVLNTGSFTFVRKTGRPSCTAIDPDSWGSDHLPIVITPAGGKIPRTRQCRTVDWRAFRQQLKEAPNNQDFLDLVAAAAQAATIQYWVPENHPVPDLRHLNLRATRCRAERKYLKTQCPDHRTLFNRVDAVRGGAKAWRLLRSLVIGPMARQPVLAVAIRLGISEQELAERLADRCAPLPLARPAPITTTPTPKQPQGHHPAWTASQIAALAFRRLVLGDRPIPWSKAVTYLRLKIDHRLTWIPAVKLATFKATSVETAVGKLLSRGQGCTTRLALQLYQGGATAVQTYAVPLVQPAQHRKEQLERQHRMAIRRFMVLPRQSPVAASVAEAQTWPLSLLMLRQALHHVDHLHRAPGGDALLRRLRSRPASRMGQICTLYEELVPAAPCPIQPPPPHQQPLDMHSELGNLNKRRTPVCELHQSAVAKLHDRLRGHLLYSILANITTGPSMTIDTACSSTLVALNEAVLALRSGRCEAAIVGAGNLNLDPCVALNFKQMGVLSEDGKCKSFDSNGDGYVRSEVIGCMFLQRFSDARRVYTKVVNVNVNTDGYKLEGMPFPSAIVHEQLLRATYAEANVDPQKVVYVEAHGTGTKVGGPQELEAISNALCPPEREKPLKVGSVKSNMGHAESACG
ncbi:hypothetical protein HPB52_002917 [Rhipicephalus sanguineus]|uniref:Fatty acid synthase n=1 Tax=Rhipicephalus sanguineus TaxID=34632 RepID=A0A9D4PGW1_RHISA|nr:hypothetical protein HPB52_002917 [Rhipicephalus sanguineus]